VTIRHGAVTDQQDVGGKHGLEAPMQLLGRHLSPSRMKIQCLSVMPLT
jgi:hypothetical protein